MIPLIAAKKWFGKFRRANAFQSGLLALAVLPALAGCAGLANSPSAADAPQLQWVDAWGTSFLPTTINGRAGQGVNFDHQTIRLNVFAKLAGAQARVKFTNKFGTEPLQIGAAHIARRANGPAIDPASDKPLTFDGSPSVTLAPGEEKWSDAANIAIGQHTDVAISVFVNQAIKPATFHPTGLKTMYLSGQGDFTGAETIARPARNPTINALYFVSGLQVLAPARSHVIVTFGDSITDGAASTIDTDTCWPDLLSKRLPALADGTPVSVVNVGIGSNRLVSADAAGPAGVKRFDDDVLSRSHVTQVIVFEGINDISYEHAAPEQLIAADKQLIAKAHAKGIKIYGATLLPILHSTKWSPENEATRSAVNQWIRTSGEFDAVLDFEKAVLDPAEPLSIRAELTSDHVHPNSKGYKLIADSINLDLFK